MAIRQREYKIPEDKRDEAKRLSRDASHANVLQQTAQSRLRKAMDEGDDRKATDAFDDLKARGLAFENAQAALLDFLKSLDASIETEPQNWMLAADDETLVYQPPRDGATFPGPQLLRPGRN